MEQELVAKLKEFYGADLTPTKQKHLEFALSNRRRAIEVLDSIVVKTGIELAGARVLDVGSAYGGMVIEAAARGAEAWGVEIAPRLHKLGALHARGEAGRIHQVQGDILSRRVLDELPRDFDLVILNDVFEHVYDTASLLKQLHVLMKPGARFMYAIPNGDAVTAVEKEGHYGVPGITLLPPNRWHRFHGEYTAYYHPWSHYTGLFRAFGFETIEVWRGKRYTMDAARDAIRGGMARAEEKVAALGLEAGLGVAMAEAMAEYRRRVEADLASAELDVLIWRYLQTFWKGCAIKGGPVLADVDERPVERVSKKHTPQQLKRSIRGLARKAQHLVRDLRQGSAPARPEWPKDRLVPITLQWPAKELQSRWVQHARTDVAIEGGAIHCNVVASDGAGSHYGGVRLPIARTGRVRLDLELIGAEDIEAVYLDGEARRGKRHVRWQWSYPRPDGARVTLELTAGKPSHSFLSVAPTSVDDVAELHLFIRVARGRRAGFVLHGLAVGA